MQRLLSSCEMHIPMLECLFIRVFFSIPVCAVCLSWFVVEGPKRPRAGYHACIPSRLDHPELLLLQLASLPVACAS